MEIIVPTIPDGVAVRFTIGKSYGINQDIIAYFEEDADFCYMVFHFELEPAP